MLKSITFKIIRVLLFCVASMFISTMAQLAKTTTSQVKYISVEVDRADKKYLGDETAYFKVSHFNSPTNGILTLDIDAYYLDGTTKKTLTRVGDFTKSGSRYSLGVTQNVTITFDAYLVDMKLRESLGQKIAKKTKQISDLIDIIATNPDPDLIWRKESLEADLVFLNQQYSATRTKVQSELISLVSIPNDLSLEIISPIPNSMFSTDKIEVKGVFTSSIPGLELYVDGRQVSEAHSGEVFTVEIHPENLGYSRSSVEIRRGARVLKKVLTDYGYLPPTSTLSNIGPAGGELEITNPDSPIFGTKVTIPAGSLDEKENIILHEPYEYVPVPADFVAVGNQIQISPYFMNFNKDVEISIPFNSAELTKSRIPAAQLEVLALVNGKWVKLPATIFNGTIKVIIGRQIVFQALSLVYAKVLSVGEMKIMSNLPTSQQVFVYLDEKLVSTKTPVIAKGVQNGHRYIRLMSDGYEEIVSKVEFLNTGEYFFVFKPASKPPPDKGINLPANYSTFESIENVYGNVRWTPGVNLRSIDFSYYVNGRHFRSNVNSSGSFYFQVPLALGRNRITVHYKLNGIQLHGSMEITRAKWNGVVPKEKVGKGVYNPNDDYLVVINWEPKWDHHPNWDIWFLLEDSHHKKFGYWWNYYDEIAGGSWGGGEDWDVGQISKRYNDLPKDKYKISIQNHDGTYVGHEIPNRVYSIRIFQGGELIKEYLHNLEYGEVADDMELITDGSKLEVTMGTGLLNSDDVGDPSGSCVYDGRCTIARFLAGYDNEDKLLVGVDAEPSIADSEISFDITEVHTNTKVPSVAPAGRVAEIKLPVITEQMRGADSGKFVREPVPPITYKIVAKARGKESNPFFVVQDQRSRIRQEYFDWKAYHPELDDQKKYGFRIPTYGEIQDGTKFVKNGFYGWTDFVQDPWYYPGPLGFVNDSQKHAETVAAKYNKLNRPGDRILRLSSGWRNPRKNAGLAESAVNSGHLWGNSVDFAPPWAIKDLGKSHLEFKRYLKNLCNFVGANLPGKIEVFVHNKDHVHIENNPKGRVDRCDSFNAER